MGIRIKEIRELRGFKTRKELADKMPMSSMGLLYIEKGVNKPQKWLPRLSELLECTPEQLMGLEPIDGIDTPPEIEFKEKYVEYSIEIIGNLVEAEDLTKEGRAKLISDVYRLVYDYFDS